MRAIGRLGMGCLCLLLFGCGSKPKDLIIGKWNAADEKEVFQGYDFNKDGAMTMTLNDKDKTVVSGKYKFIDQDTIDMEMQVPDEVKTMYRGMVKMHKQIIDDTRKFTGALPGMGDVMGDMFKLIPDEFPARQQLKVTIKEDELTLTDQKRGYVQKLKKAK